MKEVAPGVYQVLLDALQSKGISPVQFIDVLPAGLTFQAELDWDSFAALCDRFETLYGQDISTIDNLEQWFAPSGNGVRKTPSYLYRAIEQERGPALASNLVFYQRPVDSHRVELTVEVPEPYRPSYAFFNLLGEALRRAPRLAKYADSVVEARLSARRANYIITLPPVLSPIERLKTAFRVLFDPKAARAKPHPDTISRELMMVRQQLERQQRQLQLLEKLRQQSASDLQSFAQVAVKLLCEYLPCEGAALWIQDENQTPRLLCEKGRLAGRPSYSGILQTGKHCPVRLDIWRLNDIGRAILEAVLPWLSLKFATLCLTEKVETYSTDLTYERTERERIAEEMRLAEERWRLLVEDAPAMLTVLDRHGVIQYTNRVYGGLPPDKVIGTSIYDYSPLEFHETISKAMNRAARTGQSETYEHVSATEQGNLAWFESRLRPVIRNNRVVSFTLISTDITSRRHNEHELQKHALEMQTFAEVSSEIIQTLDPEELMYRVCELTRKQFDLYHVQIYLLDEYGKTLTVAAGTGTAGQNMVKSRWSFVLNSPRQGLVVQAARTRTPVISSDVSKDNRFFYNMYLPRTRSEIALPMIVGERLLGVLDMQSDKPGRFTDADVSVLGTLAAQVAVALNNAQLFVRLRRQSEIADTLRDISVVLNSTLDLPAILERILDQVKRVLPYDAAQVRLNDGTGQFYPVAWVGYERFGNPGIDHAPTMTIEDSRLLRIMVTEKRSLIISDLSQDPSWTEIPAGYEWVQSWAGTPIVVEDRLIGMVGLEHSQVGFYNAQHLPLLESLQTQVSIAMTNARLFEAERRRRQEIESVQRSSLSLTSVLELPQVLDAVIRAVVDLTRADDVHIFLYDGDQLRFGAGLHLGEPIHRSFISPRPDGLTYHVARKGEAFILNNTRQHPLYQERSYEFMSAIMALPLKIGERVVGVMNIVYADPHNFEEATIQALQLLVNQASIAIENAHLYEEVRREREIADTLRDIGLVLNSTLDLDTVLQRILEQVERVLPYDAASIRLKDEMDVFRVVMSVRREVVKVDDSTSDKPLLPSVTTDRAMAIADARNDPQWTGYEWIGSWLGAPITLRDEIIGDFSLACVDADFYGEQHEPVMEALATQVSIAVGNAQLFEAERRRLQELEAVQKTSLSLTGSLQLPQVLDAIMESIVSLMNPELVTIFLYEGGKLEFGAAMSGITRLNKPVIPLRDDSITYTVARTGKMLRINNHDETYPEGFYRSIVSIPLKIGERVVGVMNIAYRQPHEFPDTEIQTLLLLASHASIAIENARLYQTISDYADQLADRVRERTHELERERAQLQAILDSMGEGVVYDENLEIKYYNRALLEITGHTNPQWESYHALLKQLIPSDKMRVQLMDSLYTAIGNGKAWKGEMTMYRNDGTPFEARIICHPVVSADGEINGAVMLIQDISADKELEAQKDRFIANASHELRTPLANLKTRLYLIRRQPDKQDYHMQIMEKVADQMSELVEDLLDMSRFQRGVIEMELNQVVLQDLLNFVHEVQSLEAENKRLIFSKHLPDEPVYALVDIKRLRQVVTNLVINAINYTPSGGSVDLKLLQDDDTVEIQVCDTGIGIAPEHHTQVFQPFFRATQGAERGTGLGLAISAQIVKLHGGEILLESEPGKGSIFRVRLPMTPLSLKEEG